MDIFSAFYNIPLIEESRALTTFTAPDGRRYRYRRCPFGLNNSGSRLPCNPRKTDIGASKIEYLGYRLSGDFVRMSKKRIQVINDIPAPKNLKALQRLLGMFQYWKKLVPYFSCTGEPYTRD